MGSVASTHGFFTGRRAVKFPTGPSGRHSAVGLVNYANVPRIIGTLISSRLTTLDQLQSVYGVQDAYDLLEVLSVDAHNEQVANPHGRA